MTPQTASTAPPLVVDLDGTLVRVDLLHEALAHLALRAPLRLVALAAANRHSLSRFKLAVAAAAPVAVDLLPYDVAVVDHVRREAERGRQVILATASPLVWANAVAAHLGIFTHVIATAEGPNLKGPEKLAALRKTIAPSSFAYIGDSPADLPLFAAADAGRYLAGADRRVIGELRRRAIPFEVLSTRPSSLGAHLRLLRPLHWSKNVLVALPMLTSWGLYDVGRLPDLALAFVALCAASSLVYILNDLADLASDRAHPDKRRRPLAAGLVGVTASLGLAGLAATLALTLAALAHPLALFAVVVYLALNFAYSSFLKELPLLDVLVLCGFYLLRILLGLAVLGLPAAPWFLAFLGCLFAELALWKRYVESRLPASPRTRRPYGPDDSPVLLSFGVGASFSAALVLALYLQSTQVSTVYRSPALLGFLVPIVLIHNLGMWLDASRGHSGSDPVLRVLLSRKSRVAALAAFTVIALARLDASP